MLIGYKEKEKLLNLKIMNEDYYVFEDLVFLITRLS